MSVQIQLLNQHYKWEEIRYNGIRYILKGNLFYNNELLSAEKLVNLLSSLVHHNKTFDIERLHEFLKYMNGEFAIVVDTPEEVICSVDRIRSIPLFYTQKNDDFIISDNAYYIKDSIGTKLIEENAAEFLITGYVTGKETLFNGIKQIQAGEFLVLDKRNNSARNFCNYCFYPKDILESSEEDPLYNLDAVFVNSFNRLIESTVNKGMQIVVPLSGGLDSRVIVAMLKRLGVEDVICFSYGKKNNREAKISKKVSEALGYKFYFVEYTNKKWYKCYRSENLKRYKKYASNLVSLPHAQDYLALEELIKEGKLPENSVFVPGHTGMLFRD